MMWTIRTAKRPSRIMVRSRPPGLEIDHRAGETREGNELSADRRKDLGEGDNDGEEPPDEVAPLLLAHDSAFPKGHG